MSPKAVSWRARALAKAAATPGTHGRLSGEGEQIGSGDGGEGVIHGEGGGRQAGEPGEVLAVVGESIVGAEAAEAELRVGAFGVEQLEPGVVAGVEAVLHDLYEARGESGLLLERRRRAPGRDSSARKATAASSATDSWTSRRASVAASRPARAARM